MMLLLFMAPLLYWYITIPEILYIFLAGTWGVASGEFLAGFCLIGLVVYYAMFIPYPVGTMVVAAILILIHFILHVRFGFPWQKDTYALVYTEADEEYNERYGYNTCEYCENEDIDGVHCYDCEDEE